MARVTRQNRNRDLRRYALAGNMQAVKRLLNARLSDNPDDKEARDELVRLEAGLPLRITETPRERHQREAIEARDAIRHIIHSTPADTLSTYPTPRLRQLYSKLSEHSQKLKIANVQEDSATGEYRSKLRRELQRRGLYRARRHLRTVLIALAGVAALGAAGLLCHNRANNLNRELDAAVMSGRMDKVKALLKVADTPFNRLLCSQLEPTICEANLWISKCANRQEWIEKQIARIESGESSVSGMLISLREEIERELVALPTEASDLRTRWLKLCQKENALLEQQKSDIVAVLQQQLPEVPAFTNNPEQDAENLRKQLALIHQLRNLYRDAPGSYKLSPELLSPLDSREQYIKSSLDEIADYRRLCRTMKRVHTYKQHRNILKDFKTGRYPAAAECKKVEAMLPAENKVKSLMLNPDKIGDEQELQAAIKTLIQSGPTFTQSYPATPSQVYLMEDIFTSPSLRRKLIEITHSDGPVCYSDEEPTIDYLKRVVFTRSQLDPKATPGNRNICWDDANCVWKRTIDTTNLLAATNIEKSTFFSTCNLPELLGTVLNFRDPQCPALAQAFLYHRLLRLITEHKYPIMTGLHHSPTMRKHYKSFTALLRRHHITLQGGCWLGNTPEQQQAEADFERWFREHRGADYAAEIRSNFGSILRVGPAYCGYINEKGEAVIFRNVAENTPIWYLTAEGITSTPVTDTPENALHFSPIFVAQKRSR